MEVQIQDWAQIMVFEMVYLLLQTVFEITRIIMGTKIARIKDTEEEATMEETSRAVAEIYVARPQKYVYIAYTYLHLSLSLHIR